MMKRTLVAISLLLLVGCFEKTPREETEPPQIDPLQVEILVGASAKRLCSSMFVSGRSREHVFAEELNDPNSAQMQFAVDRKRGLVEARLMDQVARVVYRPGLGCTLAKGVSVRALRDQFDMAEYPDTRTPAGPWPLGNDVSIPLRVEGIDLSKVNNAVERSFEDITEEQDINTRAVLVVYKGDIIAERYAAPFDADTPQLGWSMTKTVMNALTAVLVADNRLDVRSPAPVPEWHLKSGDPRAHIKTHHLLKMSSGLEFSENYSAGSVSDVIVMLYARGDFGGFAAAKPAGFEPDKKWYYSSGTTNLISRIHRGVFESQQAYFNFPRERLFNPLGMASAVIEPDASGVFVGSSYMYATPRDWAKIGLLYLNDGVWNGERILPEGWVDYSLEPASAAPRGAYGAQIWLNRGEPGDSSIRPHPGLPPSMFYLSGFEGQNVVVIPEKELIVVRMGLTRSGPRPIWNLAKAVIDATEPIQVATKQR